jgi:phenylpropionate dioxygenase-like ring-hydroxylating dioxygenase large terminal subunit
MVDPQAVEARVNRGVLNQWYPVLPSWALAGNPIGITRLSENIVLWRDERGQVQALEDRCPHRGARLSLGWNLGDRLACWYHGVEVNGAGTVCKVPAVSACPLEGTQAVKRYHVKEARGGIFVYFGDELHAEPCQLTLPEELANEAEYGAILCFAKWKCNYRYAIDNVMDPMHGAYLHALSHSMAAGDKTATMQVKKTAHGISFEKTNQRDVNFDWVELGETGATWLRLGIPYRASAGPGGNFGIVGFVTPVDEDNCCVFFWRTRKASGWVRDVWQFMYRTKLEGLHWAVLEQDRFVLEHMAPDARSREFLYQHDTGLARVRRILQKNAESQLGTLEQAKTTTDAARNAA